MTTGGSAELLARVRALADGTPYTQVELDEDAKRLTITDHSTELGWRVGAAAEQEPVASFQFSHARGRIYGRSTRKTFAWDERGRYGAVVDYHLDHSEGRNLVRTAKRELGWTERMPVSAKIGLVAGLIGGVGGLAAGVTLLVAWLTGKF